MLYSASSLLKLLILMNPVLSFEGRLWIHAASKVPEEATIKAMEEFYREIYAVNGITEIKFPEHYPVSRLLGIWDFGIFTLLLFVFLWVNFLLT